MNPSAGTGSTFLAQYSSDNIPISPLPLDNLSWKSVYSAHQTCFVFTAAYYSSVVHLAPAPMRNPEVVSTRLPSQSCSSEHPGDACVKIEGRSRVGFPGQDSTHFFVFCLVNPHARIFFSLLFRKDGKEGVGRKRESSL